MGMSVLVLEIFIMLADCEINSRALLTNSTLKVLGCGKQLGGHSGVQLHRYYTSRIFPILITENVL